MAGAHFVANVLQTLSINLNMIEENQTTRIKQHKHTYKLYYKEKHSRESLKNLVFFTVDNSLTSL